MRAVAASTNPRVLLAGRTRYQVPFTGAEARKFTALGELMTFHLLARSRRGHRDEQRTLLGRFPFAALDGLLFHLRLPLAIARLIRRWQPQVIVAQDPFIGAAALAARWCTRSDLAVVVEVHGDWRTATRLYGSKARRILARPADALADAAIRRADAVRAVSDYTALLVRNARGSVEAQFPAWLDLEPFYATPPVDLPKTPTALFVGVLERYKNIDRLLDAWPAVHTCVPEARLRIVGTGSLASRVARATLFDESIEHRSALSREGIVAALDGSTLLVLPSRSEGMGRIVVEALARGRAVVASTNGGLPELVENGLNGLLVPADDVNALEDALIAVLTNRKVAAQSAPTASREPPTCERPHPSSHRHSTTSSRSPYNDEQAGHRTST